MRTILVVDDDPGVVEGTRAVLESAGYGVVTAASGEEGFAKAKAAKPDLMLLDVMMAHDTEGFETARRMADDETTRRLPVILITGIRKAKGLPFRFDPDPEWLPVKAVLEKPVRPEELLRQVKEALG